ncbi:MAG: hypothetical protein KXJ50_10510 [Vulcanococcus sp.]|jgi:hypothetical protein|uniref:Eco57I restriction-modification methylase domain-containing protein n=1 Tax=Vulcanococcus sp. TaxID=2856995 RepID=UPI0025FEAB55|nr:hypothetical protein [Vulcanococcus sp.]MBW0173946.1 hypothetical protein [Vulcanococcus sp.]MBW0181488.1 hypothetical protein [Vulcanococcus sp.]
MSEAPLPGWDRLRHGGLLLDPQRLQTVAALQPGPLGGYHDQELRRQAAALLAGDGEASAFVAFVVERVCGFAPGTGAWARGSAVGSEWNRRTPTGETLKPRHLWRGAHGALLPVFLDSERQVGIGRGRRTASQVVQWLRAGGERLALLTNGRQWRLIFAGLDFDAWCEWDVDLWFEEGELSPQVQALRTLLSPQAWTPEAEDQPGPLLQAVLDSRKGQAELSAALGERVREAVELLVQSHGDVLQEQCADTNPADIYRAAVRVVMRLVVVLFAESRDLLPRDNALYHGAYGVGGLLEELEKTAARGGSRLARSWSAWPRLLALFRLVHQGSHHPALPVPAYGGELFEPAVVDENTTDELHRALHVFETAAFDTSRGVFPDRDVHRLLEKISRTRVKLRQGRQKTWVTVPVDFSDLSSEYIGILYEGLLDFELKTAPSGNPVIFLAVGNQPALPLSRLEEMDDRALAALLEKMKDTSSGDDEEAEEVDEAPDEAPADTAYEGDDGDDEADEEGEEDGADGDDDRHVTRTRAEVWARRAVEAGRLVRRPRATANADTRRAYEESVARKARQLVVRVVLPGEWYLVRWGGTRKGSGTFYTRPGLAVPTVQRTLRPLLYDPPAKDDGTADREAQASTWLPKHPEEILAIKTCDSACGSGTFPVAALRYITDALYASVHHHGRVTDRGDRSVVSLLRARAEDADDVAALGQELIPCPSEDASFEPRLRAVLKRHVVERCIYGVDLDPLAVELCRLSLWIETMDRTLPFSFLDHKVKCGNALVGTWFDQFLHYPVMAWKNREGGDKNHSNGVHFAKEARGKALREFANGELKSNLKDYLTGQLPIDPKLRTEGAEVVHAQALALLNRLHGLPVQDAAERARIYRDELLGASTYKSLKAAMDLWCACWFWPAEALEQAPLPTTFSNPSEETCIVAEEIAARLHFFHWELEFPDVFCSARTGFDAVLGNPPWETLQPNSKEFFSNLDPLYRTYGKREALMMQARYFEAEEVESRWLDYNALFAASSNWFKYASKPFGDLADQVSARDTYNIAQGGQNKALHLKWREIRSKGYSYAEATHPFRNQGEGKAYTYKLFLEHAYVLSREGGRLGLIVPCGIYSDTRTAPLRRLFLDQCNWEWLFGFENRDKIFIPIDGRYKFNPVILTKGGYTHAIKTAFMRRKLDDWSTAEELALMCTRELIERFSPFTSIFVEFSDASHAGALRKLYDHSSSLSASVNSSKCSAVRCWQGDINLTSKVSLAIHRTQLSEMRLDLDQFGRAASCENIPALPIYQGAMIHHLNPMHGRYLSGRGHNTQWESADFTPGGAQFWLPLDRFQPNQTGYSRLTSRRLVNPTNERTMISAVTPDFPSSDTTLAWQLTNNHITSQLLVAACVNSLAFDWIARARIAGATGATALDLERISELPIPLILDQLLALVPMVAALNLCDWMFAPQWLQLSSMIPAIRPAFARLPSERLRRRCIIDAVLLGSYGLDTLDAQFILKECDYSKAELGRSKFTERLDQKGFWRVDKDKDPELRHTVLTLVAFQDLKQKIHDHAGDREAGIESFLTQNDGEGWLLPETVRLADYGLGHDARALEHQPVASRLGPRFYDWQLAQSAEESWRECHLHARNLLGEAGYQQLLAEIEAERSGQTVAASPPPAVDVPLSDDQQLQLFS